MIACSDSLNSIFQQLSELLDEEVVEQDKAQEFMEWIQENVLTENEFYWIADDDWRSHKDMATDAFEAGLKLAANLNGRTVFMVELSWGGELDETSEIFLVGHEVELVSKLDAEFKARFTVPAVMAC